MTLSGAVTRSGGGGPQTVAPLAADLAEAMDCLTPAGKATLNAGHAIADEVLASSFAGLSDAQRAQRDRLLTRALGVPRSDGDAVLNA